MSISKTFIIITAALVFTFILIVLTHPAFANYSAKLGDLMPGIRFPGEIPRDIKLSNTFVVVEGSEGVGIFRFATEKNHYDIFVDYKNSEVSAIRAYIDGEWRFWEYDVRGIPQPISEERFFEIIELLRNRK